MGGREIGCNYALAMGAYRENLKYRVRISYRGGGDALGRPGISPPPDRISPPQNLKIIMS